VGYLPDVRKSMKFICKLILVLPLVSMIAVSGCSTANIRVMPGPDGTIRAVVVDVDKHEAEQAAFEAAKSYCEDRGEETVFLADDVEYTGDMDESEREQIRKASDSATVLAGVIRATEASDSAAIFEGGAAVGRSVTSGKDYEAEVRFVCSAR
jgi:hypothetical protein